MRKLLTIAWISVWSLFPSITWGASLDIPFVARAPSVDGKLAWGEWDQAVNVDLNNGFLALAHDGYRLYILIDVLNDDGDDPYRDDGQDQFWLLFDVDEDGAPTPEVDLRYRLSGVYGNLRYQRYCDECGDNFNPLEIGTYSSRAEGFGCFVGDRTALFFPLQCAVHRVWELAIDLSEIGASSDYSTRLGYRISSGTPEILEQAPADPLDFANYLILNLVLVPRRPVAVDPGPTNVKFEVTQSIQTPQNELDLAAGKRTAVRIWDETRNASTFKNFIYGTRENVDLPGSPLLSVAALSALRDSIQFNSFTVLPDAWTEAGNVDFDIVVQQLDDSIETTLSTQTEFVKSETPLFWTVPLRNEFVAGSLTEPDPAWIQDAEQALRSVAPLADIDILRRPTLDVAGITLSEELKERLNTYDLQTTLAWSLMLFLTGEATYQLPDQITGVSDRALVVSTDSELRAGGSSDPTWAGGAGRISWISPEAVGGVFVYPHELNHNLDTGDGTWGMHSGCIGGWTPKTDPEWPYYIEDNPISIQEVGVSWQGTEFISVSDKTPDLMTYCQAEQKPLVWMSPYRWNAWLNRFRAEAIVVPEDSLNVFDVALVGAAPQMSFYIAGRIYPDGSGQLQQVLRHPGMSEGNDGEGAYTLRVLDCEGANIDVVGLAPEFVGAEGEPRPFVSFSRILAAPSDACSIVLEHYGTAIDSRIVTDNAPWITLLSPYGGEYWDGIETVSWEAGDDDGDSLLYTILFSPDNGTTWYPVETAIDSDYYEVASEELPGSDEAIIRVLASDGANTGYDQSETPFTVKAKQPEVVIATPREGSVHDANSALHLEGYAHDIFGNRFDASRLVWTADGIPVGMGSQLAINLDEGEYLIGLLLTDGEDIVAQASSKIIMTDLNGGNDPIDTTPISIDVVSATGFLSGEFFVCEMLVRSEGNGLVSKSDFTCHLDFNDLESERDSRCYVDGKPPGRGSYRLGSNGECSTSDMALNYRVDKYGGACTGGPGVLCTTDEYSATGALDSECDGEVTGESATFCRIRMVLPLAVIQSERDKQCGAGDCLGEVNAVTGEYPVYGFYDAHLRSSTDWIPDTDDGNIPNSLDEVFYMILRQ